jgi:shikimate kinase
MYGSTSKRQGLKMKNNIIIIGFMGVGKGTMAREYNKKYGTYIIDTDDLIESKNNRVIKKIFKKFGESFFRQEEQNTANWIEECVDNSFISCGGGFYKVNNLKKLGKIVLLDASFEWIHNRLKNDKNAKSKLAKRPLFNNIDEARKLYDSRVKEYRELADIVVDIENLTTMEQLEKIYDGSKR